MANPAVEPTGQKAGSIPEEVAAPASPPGGARLDIFRIPAAKHVGLTTYDAKDPDTPYPPIVPLRPPEGAPNVLIVLLDDVGFGAASAFGGPCNTPTAERLGARAVKLNRFHTTALSSPTRQAMLTGRNHHSVGMGGVTEIATSAPGYSSIRPKDKAPAANSRFRNEDPYSKNHGSSSNPTPTAPRGFVMDLVIELLGVGQFRCVRDRIVFQTRMI